MEARIYDRVDRDTVHIILGYDRHYLMVGDPLDPSARIVEECAPYSERPDFLVLTELEYAALERAVMERAGARLAERALLAATIVRERALADRLLTLVENVVAEP